MLRMLRDAGLPEPETNVRVGRWEVDFLWREAGFVLEVDAYSTHSRPGRSSATAARAPSSRTSASPSTGSRVANSYEPIADDRPVVAPSPDAPSDI